MVGFIVFRYLSGGKVRRGAVLRAVVVDSGEYRGEKNRNGLGSSGTGTVEKSNVG